MKGGKLMRIENQEDVAILRTEIEKIADDLFDLYMTIDTIALGMESEQIEPQVIACLRSINKCVGFIQHCAKNMLQVQIEDDEKEQGHE